MTSSKPVPTPMATSHSLSISSNFDLTKYQSAIGDLQYVTMTRLHISFTINKLAQAMSFHTTAYLSSSALFIIAYNFAHSNHSLSLIIHILTSAAIWLMTRHLFPGGLGNSRLLLARLQRLSIELWCPPHMRFVGFIISFANLVFRLPCLLGFCATFWGHTIGIEFGLTLSHETYCTGFTFCSGPFK